MTFLLALIPALPLLAALAIGLGARAFPGRSHRLAIPAVVASFVISLAGLLQVVEHGPVERSLYRLLSSGQLTIDMTLYLDQLAAVVLVLVTGVSSIVHVYSVRYMSGDPRYDRFFALIALFTGLMVMLVLSANLFMLYLCWELMGLCSYLLISHRAERPAACRAATKAFLVNAVADVGLGLGIFLSFVTFGTLDLRQIIASIPAHASDTVHLLGWVGLEGPVSTMTVIALLFFIGASGKSAQLPFHVWLPLAMEAPTPVSALIHAATMVNAGVFLIVRLHPLYATAPLAMMVMAVVGGATALFAGLVSWTQPDIKRTLAYSTISQLGFMMLACGMGAVGAAVFHLLAHGALKAFLFLSTGNAVRAVSHGAPHGTHPQLRPLGRSARWGHAGVAVLLATLPAFLIFSPSYASLWGLAGHSSAGWLFWVLGLGIVFLTAQALCRHLLTAQATGHSNTHTNGWESAASAISLPPGHAIAVILLASAALGGVLTLAWIGLRSVLTPVLATAGGVVQPFSAGLDSIALFGLPLAAAVVGCWLAMRHGVVGGSPARPPRSAAVRVYVVLLNAAYLDERYEVLIVNPLLRGARWLWQSVEVRGLEQGLTGLAGLTLRLAGWLWRAVDVHTIDGAVTRSASLTVRMAAWLWQVIDIRGIDRSVTGTGTLTVSWAQWLWSVVDVKTLDRNVDRVGLGADSAGHAFQRIEPRMLQHHVMMAVFWVAVVLALFYLMLR